MSGNDENKDEGPPKVEVVNEKVQIVPLDQPYEANLLVKKYVIDDPFNSRPFYIRLFTKVPGVYVFHTACGNTYVGSSQNLYSRVIDYFTLSNLKRDPRKVNRHFLYNGYNGLKLVIYVPIKKLKKDDVIR